MIPQLFPPGTEHCGFGLLEADLDLWRLNVKLRHYSIKPFPEVFA
jgi:hypothetical protein